MPLSAENLALDARALLADFPQAATFSRPGRTPFEVAAAIDFSGGGQTLADDGAARYSTAYASATVVADDCAWRPRVGDRVRLFPDPVGRRGDGRAYRVSSVREVPGDPCLTIDMEAWT